MLNFERLRVLHAVSTTGSVAGAARVLHVTTSAISQQMARLERETGQRLAERQGRGIRLTEAGLLLARNAGYLLAQVEQVEADLAGHSGAVTGTLNIAAFATAARGLLPGVLRDLRSRYPDLSVSLSEQEPHEAIPALSRGHLDVAVVQDWAGETPAVPGGLSRLDLIEDPFDPARPRARTATCPVRATRPAADTPHLRPLAGKLSRASGHRRHPERAPAPMHTPDLTAIRRSVKSRISSCLRRRHSSRGLRPCGVAIARIGW